MHAFVRETEYDAHCFFFVFFFDKGEFIFRRWHSIVRPEVHALASPCVEIASSETYYILFCTWYFPQKNKHCAHVAAETRQLVDFFFFSQLIGCPFKPTGPSLNCPYTHDVSVRRGVRHWGFLSKENCGSEWILEQITGTLLLTKYGTILKPCSHYGLWSAPQYSPVHAFFFPLSSFAWNHLNSHF